MDSKTEADCLGARATWGADECLWALAPEQLKLCAAADIPVLTLMTQQLIPFSDGRSLHRKRPLGLLAVAFGITGPAFMNVTGVGQGHAEVVAKLRSEVLSADWLVGFDSDTAYHVTALRLLLQHFPSPQSVPYILGHIVDLWGRTFPSGGSGMAISRKAAELLGRALKAGQCSAVGASDSSLGDCAALLGIPLTNVPGFLSEDVAKMPRDVLSSLAPRLLSSHRARGLEGHLSRWQLLQ